MEAKHTGVVIKLSGREMQLYEAGKKAGKESLLEKIKADDISAGSLIHAAKKAGIREVVKVVERKGWVPPNAPRRAWDLRKKEWGIE